MASAGAMGRRMGFGAPGAGETWTRSAPNRSRSAIETSAPWGGGAEDPSVRTVTAMERSESPVADPVAASAWSSTPQTRDDAPPGATWIGGAVSMARAWIAARGSSTTSSLSGETTAALPPSPHSVPWSVRLTR